MKHPRIVIVGGVAGGANAAGKAARTNKDAQITVFERTPYISYANCGLPYYIGGEVPDRGQLIIRKPEDFKSKYGIDVFINNEVTRINRPQKTVTVKDLVGDTTREVEYDKLILAPGAYTFIPPIPGIDASNVFTLRTVPDVDAIETFIRTMQPRRAVVLGGGYIGVEAADALRNRGIQTTLIEMMPQVLTLFDPEMAEFIQAHMHECGINVMTGEKVVNIENDAECCATSIITESGVRIDTDMIIASMGVRPNIQLAKEAGLELGKFGVVVDDYMRTSDPDIFAAGDVVQIKDLVTGKPTWSPLAGPADMQGKIAGANAVGANLRYRGTLRTSILKFNNIAGARTGLNEREAQNEGMDYFPVSIKTDSHAHYIPGSKPLHTKILVRKTDGRLLGAQIVGFEGVDKRIDVFATALAAKMNVEDLEQLNLSYAPHFSHSLDAVNIAGSMAVARLDKVKII